MRYGIDHLLQQPEQLDRKARWGLVTNDAARTQTGALGRAALQKAGWRLHCLFAPEHGLSATNPDGHAQPHRSDPVTGLPVYSLYGPTFAPTLGKLTELDGLLFDLPDAGVRFYTYLWTLSYVMEACQEAQKLLVVLDRPNPLSGDLSLVEGPMLDEVRLSSFIGRWRMPVRHGLTLGELARFWRAERDLASLDLTVIPCRDWRRDQYLTDTDLPFYPPSPALNRPETLLTYPALCFLEGANISEGRGTSLSFRQFGAPWLAGDRLAVVLNDFGFPGVSFRPCSFRPKSGRYTGKVCRGVRLEVKDRGAFRPVRTGIGLLALLKRQYSETLQWATYPTHANPSGEHHLDLLLGNADIRLLLEQSPRAVLDRLEMLTAAPGWAEQVEAFLLYHEYQE